MTMLVFLADGMITPMPHDIDAIVQFIAWFHTKFPMEGLFCVTVLFDILFGIFAACRTKTLSSTISQKGMIGKAYQVSWVAFGSILQPYSGLPSGGMVATFFVVTNVISMTENSARAGVPIPPVILDWLQRIRNNEKASVVAIPIAPNTTIGHATQVDIHMTEPVHETVSMPDHTTTTTTTVESSTITEK